MKNLRTSSYDDLLVTKVSSATCHYVAPPNYRGAGYLDWANFMHTPCWWLFLALVLHVYTFQTARSCSSPPCGEMSSSATALDFREMLQKERRRAAEEYQKRKYNAKPSDSRARTRYLARRHERLDLKGEHRVGGPVGGLYYVPDFITAGEGRLLQEAIQRQPEQDGSNSEWKDLHKRRLQIHGGTPHPSGMVEEALPPFLSQALVEAGVFPASSPPNHVLLNEYTGGQGIGPHKDGPLYEGRVAILSLGAEARLDFWSSLEDAEADCAAAAAAADSTSSTESSGIETMGKAPPGSAHAGAGRTSNAPSEAARGEGSSTRALTSVKCEHCSLIVFEGQAYYDMWHGIASTLPHRSDSSELECSDAGHVGCRSHRLGCASDGARDECEDGTVQRNGDSCRGTLGGHPCEGVQARGGHISRYSGDCGNMRRDKRLSLTIRRVARVVPADSAVEHPEARRERERRRLFFERSVTETGTPSAKSSARSS